MLRFFLRLFHRCPQRPTPIDTNANHVVLYARVDRQGSKQTSGRETATARHGQSVNSKRTHNHGNHRERLMAMRVEHTRLCSEKRCQRLQELGIVTAGHLATADVEALSAHFGAPRKAARVLSQYRRAIRLAASVPGMMPRDAQLLISIHRRSARGLASESPALLHRDLQRFAESTPGRQQLRGRRLPSLRRIKRWIAACEHNLRNRPLHVPAG